MRLVMFASAIAFGLVAGLSQADDWREPRVGAQIVRFDPDIRATKRPRNNAGNSALKTGGGLPHIKYEIGPALGYVVLGGSATTTPVGPDASGAYGVGLALAISDQWSLSGEALAPGLLKNTYTTRGADTGRFIVRAAFRF